MSKQYKLVLADNSEYSINADIAKELGTIKDLISNIEQDEGNIVVPIMNADVSKDILDCISEYATLSKTNNIGTTSNQKLEIWESKFINEKIGVGSDSDTPNNIGRDFLMALTRAVNFLNYQPLLVVCLKRCARVIENNLDINVIRQFFGLVADEKTTSTTTTCTTTTTTMSIDANTASNAPVESVPYACSSSSSK